MDYSFGYLDIPPNGGVIVDHLNNASAKNSPCELRRTVLTRRTAFFLNTATTNHMNNNYYNLDMESLEDMLKKVIWPLVST
jgi:hypothetical protein